LEFRTAFLFIVDFIPQEISPFYEGFEAIRVDGGNW
jgi:hypothetical protein